MLRLDNGTEYTSDRFEKLCQNVGIEHQLTAPYTPQQNGVSERKNRTIMEKSRCLLYEKGLPKYLWVEAANTAAFLLNRLPTKAVDGKTPFEVKRDKLDKKAEPGVFIGYSTISKAYKIFQPHTKKIMITSNLSNFDEDIDDQPVRGTRLLSEIYQKCNVAILEPSGFEETILDPKWKAAMEEELGMIEKNKTWQLVEKPQDRKIIGVKLVYRTKLNADGSINKLKARLVVKGYAQIFGVDYSDTFAPVARFDTI
ncbi:uncharacterized protein LOC124891115, partial [Capsicum annuum]|uniref:uncharacterized protein LOC124891115 n=1 Tax=Capsicum annuum TaxID=4072 RepID=UPI001FB094F1